MSGAVEARPVARVTGGGTGIGAAISQRLLTGGYGVLAVQQTEFQAEDARRLFAGERGFAAVAFDLATDEGCRRAVEACVAQFGELSVLINNAAVTGPAAISSILDEEDEAFSVLIDVNLKAPHRLARYAAHHMKARGGVIVNVGSTASFAAQAGAAAYSASKAGLLGLTRGLALDLAKYNIRVVLVAPGAIETDTSTGAEYAKSRTENPYRRTIPLERRGAPQEVAEAVAYLCSPAAAFITGTSLVLDGGVLAY